MKNLSVAILLGFAFFAQSANAQINPPAMEGSNDVQITSTRVGFGLDFQFPLADQLLATLHSKAEISGLATITVGGGTEPSNNVVFTINLHGGGLIFPQGGPNYDKLCVMTLPLSDAVAGDVYDVELHCGMKQYYVTIYGDKAYTWGSIRVTNERTGEVTSHSSTQPISQDGLFEVAGIWMCDLQVYQDVPNTVNIYSLDVFRAQ